MKKRIKIHRILVVILTLLVLYVGFRYYDVLLDNTNENNNKETSTIALSLEDNFKKNEYWSGTFNLLWNNLYDELDLKKVTNTNANNEKLIANLDKKTFNKKYISGNSYYIKHGSATASLKKTIEKDLKKKFNIKSNVLDNFDWNANDYFLYAMLYKEFKFKYKFEEFDNEKFKNTDNVKYFGIKTNQNVKLRDQVVVLYYQDINNFAVKLLTNTVDEVILTRGIQGDNFLSLYENMNKLSEKYDGSEVFGINDQLKVPVIDFNNQQSIDELVGVSLNTKVDVLTINKIIRDTSFKLDANGGKLKDEVASSATTTSLGKNSRLFYLTSDFNLFLKEKNADLPYFAMNVSDITKFQNIS